MNQDKSKGAASQPASQPAQGHPRVVMETSMGRVVIELYEDKAPVTVENFLKYVDDKFYNGTVFHRVIATFMIQGGGFGTDKKEKKVRSPIENEAKNGLKNSRGTLAMARTNDPNSATAQFFINVKDNGFLDYSGAGPRGAGYAVFGKVVEGMDVVDKIKNTPTGAETFVTPHGAMPFEDAPKQAVVIESIQRQ